MLVHPQFDPVAFSLGPFAVRWYGLMYLLGFISFVVLGKHRARENLLTGFCSESGMDQLSNRASNFSSGWIRAPLAKSAPETTFRFSG